MRDVEGVQVVQLERGSAVLELLAPGADQRVLAEAVRRGPVRAFAPVRPTRSQRFQEVSR